jgi:hypothetical protein
MPDVQREILPVPDRTYPGLTTYDARDPDTSFPAIGRLRPPTFAPNILGPAMSRRFPLALAERTYGAIAERRRSPSDSTIVFSTRRRREHCKNPNAAGQAVWVDARQWGSVGMTARD